MSDFETKAKYERFAKAYEFYFDKIYPLHARTGFKR